MNALKLVGVVLLAVALAVPETAFAFGRGGGGRGGGMRGGGGAMRGGGGRPSISAPRPQARPSFGGGGGSRPSISRPTPSQPNFSRPNISRPTTRPSGGLTPSRPSAGGGRPSFPTTRPAPQPSRPNVGGSRPNLPSRPGGGTPSQGNRPTTRPGTSLPNRPTTRPGGARPSLPNRPSNPGRPSLGGPNGGARPRPTPGDVGDFLGLDKPLRPGTGDLVGNRPDRPTTLPGQRPGVGNRPGTGDRPGVGNRPGVGDRPGIGDRPGRPDGPIAGNRPDFGDRWDGNNVINQRPDWVDIDRGTNLNINNRWNNALTRPGWRTPSPARRGYWNGWADGVRHGWRHYHNHHGWFSGSWWNRHPHGLCGWHYHYWNHNRPWRYWWTVPAWTTVTGWFAWQAPATTWSEPVYYDYGSGGNVVYEGDTVYVGGSEVATAEEFAMSAMDLATVEPPATEEEAEDSEWLPLGTFAVSTDERDTDPTLTVQLAVNRDGVVAGTLYNVETDEAQGVQGSVDRETQRVAVRFGESDEVVAETGLYNLTQDEAPLLVHFGAESTKNYLLVRLDAPEEDESEGETTE